MDLAALATIPRPVGDDEFNPAAALPTYCPTLVKNQYHDGHPDLLPAGRFPRDAAQHSNEGIEVKASRYHRGWRGHNPENIWLLVFVFDSNRPGDAAKTIPARPFQFVTVAPAKRRRPRRA